MYRLILVEAEGTDAEMENEMDISSLVYFCIIAGYSDYEDCLPHLPSFMMKERQRFLEMRHNLAWQARYLHRHFHYLQHGFA